MYMPAEAFCINGAAFPSSVNTVTGQQIMNAQPTPDKMQPTSLVAQQEIIDDLPPPYRDWKNEASGGKIPFSDFNIPS